MKNYIRINNETITQIAFMPYAAYRALLTLATDHNAEIVETADKKLTAIFDCSETALNVATKWAIGYADAVLARMAADAQEEDHMEYDHARDFENLKIGYNGRADSTAPIKPEWQSDLDTLAGKGKGANREAAAILRKHNMSAQIGTEGWDYWTNIR